MAPATMNATAAAFIFITWIALMFFHGDESDDDDDAIKKMGRVRGLLIQETIKILLLYT